MTDAKKVCVKCGEEDQSQFTASRATYCKNCIRGYTLRTWKTWYVANGQSSRRLRLYGITKGMWAYMLEQQKGCCDICKLPFTKERPIHIDHAHDHCHSNKGCPVCVRGLLCPPCNQALGLLQDNPDIMDQAAYYIRRSWTKIQHGVGLPSIDVLLTASSETLSLGMT